MYKTRENGLDFDPLLNSQDPYDKYVVANARLIGQRCEAEIHGGAAGKRREVPDVVAEVVRQNGRWVFVNFHYPNSHYPSNENLLRILAKLNGSRSKR